MLLKPLLWGLLLCRYSEPSWILSCASRKHALIAVLNWGISESGEALVLGPDLGGGKLAADGQGLELDDFGPFQP